MTGEVRRELTRQAEIKAARRRVKKEKEVQKRLVKLIAKYNLQIKMWGEDAKRLWEKEQRLISKGKNFRARLIKWRRVRRQKKVEDLRKITPSIKAQ